MLHVAPSHLSQSSWLWLITMLWWATKNTEPLQLLLKIGHMILTDYAPNEGVSSTNLCIKFEVSSSGLFSDRISVLKFTIWEVWGSSNHLRSLKMVAIYHSIVICCNIPWKRKVKLTCQRTEWIDWEFRVVITVLPLVGGKFQDMTTDIKWNVFTSPDVHLTAKVKYKCLKYNSKHTRQSVPWQHTFCEAKYCKYRICLQCSAKATFKMLRTLCIEVKKVKVLVYQYCHKYWRGLPIFSAHASLFTMSES